MVTGSHGDFLVRSHIAVGGVQQPDCFLSRHTHSCQGTDTAFWPAVPAALRLLTM